MTTVEYQFTEKEAVSALLKGKRIPYWQICIYVAVLVIGAAMMLISRRESGYHSESTFSLGYFITFLGAILTVFTPLLYRATYTSSVRKNSDLFTEKYRVSFDDKLLVFESAKFRTEVFWTLYRCLSEDRNYFYLQSDDGSTMSAIPKRAFDDASLNEFRRCSQSLHTA